MKSHTSPVVLLVQLLVSAICVSCASCPANVAWVPGCFTSTRGGDISHFEVSGAVCCVMASLIGGSATRFALVKIGLTACGVVLLTQLARLRTFGGVPVGLILYSVLLLYGTLILYEFRMLNLL